MGVFLGICNGLMGVYHSFTSHTVHMPDKISPVIDDGSFSSRNLMQIGKVGHSVEWCLYFVDVLVSGITGVSAFTLRRRRSEAP